MMVLNETLSNQSLVVAVCTWLLSQGLKILANAIKNERVDFKLFTAAGGLVSSHTATVSALTTSIGLNYGFDSGLFAISAILTGVVISDARGIRQAAGKQAEILNKIIEDLYQKRQIKIERLREFLGHTALEVFYGVLLGIFIAVLFKVYY